MYCIAELVALSHEMKTHQSEEDKSQHAQHDQQKNFE